MPLPSNKIVTYKARQTPSNESSDVLIEHKAFIAAESQNGNDITWKINQLKFSAPGGDDWTKANPGLSDWVVTHADPDNPVASDFTNPPNMSGTAANDDVNEKDLDYSLSLGSCSGSEGSMYGGNVACSEYSYIKDTTTIADADEDEPEEIDLENDS